MMSVVWLIVSLFLTVLETMGKVESKVRDCSLTKFKSPRDKTILIGWKCGVGGMMIVFVRIRCILLVVSQMKIIKQKGHLYV